MIRSAPSAATSTKAQSDKSKECSPTCNIPDSIRTLQPFCGSFTGLSSSGDVFRSRFNRSDRFAGNRHFGSSRRFSNSTVSAPSLAAEAALPAAMHIELEKGRNMTVSSNSNTPALPVKENSLLFMKKFSLQEDAEIDSMQN
jgi:hypothetical protein